MKILHTADWHLGKMLHKHSLDEEHDLFLDWIYDLILKEGVDLLLISGDIFDYSNPAAKDRKRYYHFLSKLGALPIQVIITGGNHDSIGVLNAPKEILSNLNVQVIGGATDPISEEIVEVYDEDKKLKCVVAAVPFLRDKDLRNIQTDENFESREQAIRYGIKEHYARLAEIIKDTYPRIPSVAMGHLYMVGASTSESERDIHVGNAAAIDGKSFVGQFDYVALGHIHRPQRIDQNDFVRYSGSPIALSFSEKKDDKKVILLELDRGQIQVPRSILVPKFRQLIKYSGTLDEVKASLATFQKIGKLTALVELDVVEQKFSSTIQMALEELKTCYQNHPDIKVLKSRLTVMEKLSDTAALYETGQQISELSPKDVFLKRLAQEPLEEKEKLILMDTFTELLEELQHIEE